MFGTLNSPTWKLSIFRCIHQLNLISCHLPSVCSCLHLSSSQHLSLGNFYSILNNLWNNIILFLWPSSFFLTWMKTWVPHSTVFQNKANQSLSPLDLDLLFSTTGLFWSQHHSVSSSLSMWLSPTDFPCLPTCFESLPTWSTSFPFTPSISQFAFIFMTLTNP